jgi:hypothetical protein
MRLSHDLTQSRETGRARAASAHTLIHASVTEIGRIAVSDNVESDRLQRGSKSRTFLMGRVRFTLTGPNTVSGQFSSSACQVSRLMSAYVTGDRTQALSIRLLLLFIIRSFTEAAPSLPNTDRTQA